VVDFLIEYAGEDAFDALSEEALLSAARSVHLREQGITISSSWQPPLPGVLEAMKRRARCGSIGS
jgi:hypothetical protein